MTDLGATPPHQAVVLVIGGSRGIGRSIVRSCAETGMPTVLTARNAEAAELTATEVAAETGADVTGVTCEITNEESIETAVTGVVCRHGRLDGVVVCAGLFDVAAIGSMSTPRWRQTLEVNLVGPAMVTRIAAPFLGAHGRGRLIFLSSAGAVVGLPGRAAYSATKAGLEGLVRSAAAELGSTGVTVNAVAPGPIAAGMLLKYSSEKPSYLQALKDQIPLLRLGTPEEVAATTCFLLSTGAGFITGQVIRVDGGYSVARTVERDS